MQVVGESSREDAFWSWYSQSKEELIEDMNVKGNLGYGDCETPEI